MKKDKTSQSGVALLMSLGILAILSILSVAFSTNMRLMERTTRDFVHEMQARYLAEGGIEYAIAELKEDARNNFVYNGISRWENDRLYLEDIEISAEKDLKGRLWIKAIDTARQININNANPNLLAYLPDIGTAIAGYIISKRSEMPNNKFPTKQSICLSSGIGNPNEATSIYNKIKDFITTDTYIDPNVLDQSGGAVSPGRSAININSWISKITQTTNDPRERVLRDMLDAVPGFGSGYNSDSVTTVVNALKNNPNKPIKSWGEFEGLLRNAGISEAKINNILNTFNPNRAKPSSGYTTEFCFHSGGTYEITATGTIKKDIQILARKTITATVKIFDLWNQTTKAQFRQVWVNDQTTGNDISDGEMSMVTWLDRCPVISTDNWMLPTTNPSSNANYNSSAEYYIIPNSIKIGYWDDFDEDRSFSITEWVNGNSGITDHDNNGNWDMHLYGTWTSIITETWLNGGILDNSARWIFGNSSVTGWETDDQDLTEKREQEETEDDTGFFMFRYNTSADEYIYQNIDNDNTDGEYIDQIEVQLQPEQKIKYGSDPYTQSKVYRAIQNGMQLSVFIDSTLDGNFNRSFPTISYPRMYNNGWMKLYAGWGCAGCRFDNLRIIPDFGRYTSISFNTPGGTSTEWGTLWATVTLPENSGNVYFSTSIDNFTSENEIVNNAGGIFIGNRGIFVQYKARFACGDTANYLTTPVLEDIWITYLPKTKMLYWKEGGD